MQSRPSRPTLFPYTTLFRSTVWEYAEENPLPGGVAAVDTSPLIRQQLREGQVLVEAAQGVLLSLFSSDRKSTRLNSSHVKISYAVFCLKKKKKKTDMLVIDE